MNRRQALGAFAALGLTHLAGNRQKTPSSSGSLLVRGGRVVTAETTREVDVRVRDGKIARIGEKLPPSDEVVVSAEGKLVLPGGIDPHTHLAPPWADDFESGSKAALAGGITTIGCMTSPQKDEGLQEAIARETERARRQAIADIVLHPVAQSPGEETENAIRALAASGCTSLKIFMVSARFDENEAAFVELIRLAGSLGMLTLLHCEDATILAETVERLKAEGKTSLEHFAESRPVEAEVRAVERAVAICEKTGSPIYVVHLSSGPALEVARRARSKGLPFYVETRPLYLDFTEAQLRGPDGPLYVGQPPLRKASDVEALWDGIAKGDVDTLGTDHAPWTREQKLDPTLDITKLRPGVANLQTMLPAFFSEGVVGRRLPLERFVAVTSTDAAKLLGLYPKKGTIEVGSDADLVLWDPEETRAVQREDLFSHAGFSLNEGRALTGWPTLVIRRGEIVYRDRRILAPPGSGEVPARKSTSPLKIA